MALPTTMTAVGLSKTGASFDVVEEFKFPVPTPSPTQILIKASYAIRVHWAGVNYADTQRIRGTWPLPLPPFPFSLGFECVGTIAALPTDKGALSDEEYKARGFALGSRVASWTGMGMGHGTFSEYFAAEWSEVFPVPDEIPTRTAIATFSAGSTTVPIATEAYNVKAGDVVLVHTVAGSVGLFFAQLVKARGGTVIGTTSTAEKAAVARSHGADHVILYKTENVAERVREITGGLGVHAIFDGVGKDTFQTNLACIRAKGTIVWIGSASGPVEGFQPHITAFTAVKYVFASAAAYVGEKKAAREYVAEIFRLVANGTFKPVVYKEYPLSAKGVREAEEALGEGKTFGKSLIRVAAD